VRLEVQSDRSLIRAGASSTRYVRISFTAPESRGAGARLPVNVALVLDRSGSMGGQKIALARSAAQQALSLLGADDRFAVVVYDQIVDVLVESTPATSEARRHAKDALARTEARGSTDLCGGWLRGCEQVGLALNEGTLGRCLLLTDGLANHGITDRGELLRHAAELRARGVATSTFGVGADFDERLLRDIAQRSGGNFYFLEHPQQIPDLLASEMGETLEVIARRATLLVELPAGASAEPLGAREFAHRQGVLEIDLGDLISGQQGAAPGHPVPAWRGGKPRGSHLLPHRWRRRARRGRGAPRLDLCVSRRERPAAPESRGGSRGRGGVRRPCPGRGQ
jgi:Ca-activated chloride channel homolog